MPSTTLGMFKLVLFLCSDLLNNMSAQMMNSVCIQDHMLMIHIRENFRERFSSLAYVCTCF